MVRPIITVFCGILLMLPAAGSARAQDNPQELKKLDKLEGYDQLRDEKSVKKDVTNLPKQALESTIVWSEAKPTSGKAPLKVDFAADPVPGAANYTWQFGDGTATAQGGSVSHTFDKPGVYRVLLKVTSAAGALGEDELRVKVTP